MICPPIFFMLRGRPIIEVNTYALGAQRQLCAPSDEFEYNFGHGGRVVVWKSLADFLVVVGC
ncbi:MAG: hypothetical protein LBV77_03050 [Candidatus Adiutrix intracellularis]|jgi:hypothetical protein|nr:hypothetical protein [Candidatus Adiutrix intracellularis]